MKRALGWSALALMLASCGSETETPKSSLPTVSEAPSYEDRILVCSSTEVATSVRRCVTSDVDPEALSATFSRWGDAQPLWSDVLFNTASFAERYALRDTERECLRRALCRQMPFE